jgi:hypothetical protein
MSSNLILPPNRQNSVLDANLKALFNRYPYERARLESLLSEPVENRPVAQFELPAVPSKPPLRVVLLAGIGSPLFLPKYFNDASIQEDTFQTFLIENNLDFLRFCLQWWDLTKIINYPKVEWLLMHNQESIKPAFFRVLKQEHVASMMKNVFMLETEIPQPEEVKSFYKALPRIYEETTQHVMHNFGRIDDSLDGVRATILNRMAILNNPGIDDLRDVFKNVPAVIVGAGPSVDHEIENLKKVNNKVVVIAADAALKPLLKAGIRVDYCTSIERLNSYQTPFFTDLPSDLKTELVAFPVIQPEFFNLYPGPKRIVYRNYSYFAYFEKSWPKGIVKCGGSTSHLALRLADWLGCSRAHLIGLDSCYEGRDGKFRSHCSNTGYPDWGEFQELSYFAKTRQHLPPIIGQSNAGEDVYTNLTYYQWAKEYSEELAGVAQRMTIINCAEKGLKIEGIEYKPLVQALERFDEQVIEKPKPKEVTYFRSWNHKIIRSNLTKWLELVRAGMKECDILISQESLDEARFEALIFIYNFKIAVDPLFVAFVVQCCATEFFELENKWWACDKAFNVEAKEKTEITKQRFQLFEEVLVKLDKIFEEGIADG